MYISKFFNPIQTLAEQFDIVRERICATEKNRWAQARVTMGIAVYDPENDRAVIDVVRRADKVMYENKRERKKAR